MVCISCEEKAHAGVKLFYAMLTVLGYTFLARFVTRSATSWGFPAQDG